MVKKIILTGPESTGKTTLAKALAKHYQTTWVSEYARTYLENLNRPYQQNDLVEMAKGQIAAEQKALSTAQQFLFCDTSLLVIKVWSLYKYGTCDPFILNELKKAKPYLYILCGMDIPWEEDIFRENPNPLERNDLYRMYKKELEATDIPFLEVTGSVEKRVKTIQSYLRLS